jgi:hypothetical protein
LRAAQRQAELAALDSPGTPEGQAELAQPEALAIQATPATTDVGLAGVTPASQLEGNSSGILVILDVNKQINKQTNKKVTK